MAKPPEANALMKIAFFVLKKSKSPGIIVNYLSGAAIDQLKEYFQTSKNYNKFNFTISFILAEKLLSSSDFMLSNHHFEVMYIVLTSTIHHMFFFSQFISIRVTNRIL